MIIRVPFKITGVIHKHHNEGGTRRPDRATGWSKIWIYARIGKQQFDNINMATPASIHKPS